MEIQWQSDLVCCTEVITNELARGLPQKSISLTYALAIRSENRNADKPDWARINQAIIDKWGLKGLERIKKKAWTLIEERRAGITPSTP